MAISDLARARYAISAVFFVFGADVGAWVPHIPDVRAALHLSDHVLGLALLASGLGATLVLPATGAIVHRFGSKNASLLFGALASLFIPFLVREPSVWTLGLNLLLVGVCYGCLDVSMNAHSVAVQVGHGRPILSAVHGWFSIGCFAGSGGAALAVKAGIPPFAHLWVNAALMVVILAAAAPNLLPSGVDRDAEGPRFVLPHGILLALGIGCTCAFVAEGGLLDWCAVYLRSNLATTVQVGTVGAGLVAFAMAVGRFGGDRVVAACGYRRVLLWSGLICAAGVFLGVSVPVPAVCVLGFSLAMIGTANVVPILFAAAGRVPGVPAGTGLAAVNTCGYAGFLVGPPLIGYVADLRSLGFSLGLVGCLGLVVSLVAPNAVGAVVQDPPISPS